MVSMCPAVSQSVSMIPSERMIESMGGGSERTNGSINTLYSLFSSLFSLFNEQYRMMKVVVVFVVTIMNGLVYPALVTLFYTSLFDATCHICARSE